MPQKLPLKSLKRLLLKLKKLKPPSMLPLKSEKKPLSPENGPKKMKNNSKKLLKQLKKS